MQYFSVLLLCSVLHFSQAPGGVAGPTQSSWHKTLRFQLDEKEKPHLFSQASDRGEAKRRAKWFPSTVLVKMSFSGVPFQVQTVPVGGRADPDSSICCSCLIAKESGQLCTAAGPFVHMKVQADTRLTPATSPLLLARHLSFLWDCSPPDFPTKRHT